MTAKIRKGDKVIVTSGRDKGKRGEVMRVEPSESRVVVSGVNVAKRHTKQTQRTQGGIVNKELPIHLSKIAHIDPKSGEATRVGIRVLNDGRKIRFAKKSGEDLDV